MKFLKMLSSGSQNVPQVLNVFPKAFSIAHQFLSYIVWPLIQLPDT
jgi:hypothetical protein